MSHDGDFWSRRKAGVEAEAQALAVEAQVAAEAEAQARLDESRAQKSDAEILAELNLRDPDEMGAGDDFSAFMAKAVPERFRRRALRKLWLTNPVLANLDELLDYGEDYTDAALVVENMQTAYQVGKGMLGLLDKTPVEDDAETPADADEDNAALAEAAPAAAQTESEDEDEDEDAPALVEAEASPELAHQMETQVEADPDMPVAPLRRHMRFEFTG